MNIDNNLLSLPKINEVFKDMQEDERNLIKKEGEVNQQITNNSTTINYEYQKLHINF